MIPVMGTQGDAVGRRSVDAVRLDVVEDLSPAVADRPRGGYGVAGGGLLDVGRDDPDVAKLLRDLRQGGDPGAVDAVVIRDEDSHGVVPFVAAHPGLAQCA